MVIEEQNADNNETARNVYGRNLITRETSDGLVVYTYNGHSDVVAICNVDGDALVTYEYDEFGNVTVETVVDEEFANFDNPYRYAGYEYITQHYNDHGKSMGFSNEFDYSKAASAFLTKKATDTTVSFKTSNGIYFRYDTATNEFGIMNQYGGVSTYYYPDEGMDYWLKQVEKYSNT